VAFSGAARAEGPSPASGKGCGPPPGGPHGRRVSGRGRVCGGGKQDDRRDTRLAGGRKSSARRDGSNRHGALEGPLDPARVRAARAAALSTIVPVLPVTLSILTQSPCQPATDAGSLLGRPSGSRRRRVEVAAERELLRLAGWRSGAAGSAEGCRSHWRARVCHDTPGADTLCDAAQNERVQSVACVVVSDLTRSGKPMVRSGGGSSSVVWKEPASSRRSDHQAGIGASFEVLSPAVSPARPVPHVIE
jgi:hypothetical protein